MDRGGSGVDRNGVRVKGKAWLEYQMRSLRKERTALEGKWPIHRTICLSIFKCRKMVIVLSHCLDVESKKSLSDILRCLTIL